jgi:hypothetical protein
MQKAADSHGPHQSFEVLSSRGFAESLQSQCSLHGLPSSVFKNAIMTQTAHRVTGANAGGARRLQIRALWAARIAQFHR